MAGRDRHSKDDGLGKALIRQQRSVKVPNRSIHSRNYLESVIDVSDLDEVVERAEIAGRVFSALNPLPELLIAQETSDTLSPYERKQQQSEEEALYSSCLKIPRRPKWHVGISHQDLDTKERQSFLHWRRNLARLEENEKLVITPFEKNLDIWRQLWRVLERSDLVVMVVDARNPLFYWCPDLEAYVQEIDPNKRTILLLNKADLVPDAIRAQWALYFRLQGISFLFWSAKSATALLEGRAVKPDKRKASCSVTNEAYGCNELDEDIRILGREELLDWLQQKAEQISELRRRDSVVGMSNLSQCDTNQANEQNGNSTINMGPPNELVVGDSKHVVVGFIGYPNVGKSSTINSLIGHKRTGVTSTPGKTKHFQTLIISERLTLCDCPGLIFPSFTSSRSDLLASGVLPIDRMTDHRGAVQVVTELVPRATLEEVYGISLPRPKSYESQSRPPTATELIRAFAYSRGYVASSGLPDETRAGRQILKDYVNGKLLHYHLPPSCDVLNNDNAKASTMNDVKKDLCEASRDPLDRGNPTLGVTVEEQSFESGHVRNQIDPKKSKILSGSADIMDNSSMHEVLGSGLSGALEDLKSFDAFEGLRASNGAGNAINAETRTVLSHKMHKKAPRRKDRSWRVGNDGNDGMGLVRGVQKPVSYGVTRLCQTAG
eukprot:c27543_g1_i1 orf=170-2158(+)